MSVEELRVRIYDDEGLVELEPTIVSRYQTAGLA